MKELFFVTKVFIFTIALVLVMQIKVGNSTLENHAHFMIQESVITEQIQVIADGAAKITRGITRGVSEKFSGMFRKKGEPDSKKRLNLNFARSEAYQEVKPEQKNQ